MIRFGFVRLERYDDGEPVWIAVRQILTIEEWRRAERLDLPLGVKLALDGYVVLVRGTVEDVLNAIGSAS